MEKLKIGKLSIETVIPAPLAGYTDSPFRKILKLTGADLVCSEMLSVEALVRNKFKEEYLMRFDEIERPILIQLFGNTAEHFPKALELILKNNCVPDIIDINLGCSVRKIIKSKSGGFLLTQEKTISNIIKYLKNITDIPITIKMRAGWDNNSLNYIDIGAMAEQAGVNAIFFHPRTVKDLFKNTAKWEYIKELKQKIKIPVIGNGDIKNKYDALRMIKETNCDGVMIGRAIIGDPWIIKETIEYLKENLSSGVYGDCCKYENKEFKDETIKNSKIKLTELLNVIKIHLDYLTEFYKYNSIIKFRKHLVKYLKGIHNISQYREKLSNVSSREQLFDILYKIEKEKIEGI